MGRFTLTSILFLITILSAYAQQIITTIESTDSSECNGYAYFTDSTNLNPSSVYWIENDTVLQQSGFSIYRLCSGNYTVTYSDLSGNINSATFTINAGNDLCAGFYVVISKTDETAPNACDGAFNVNAYGGVPIYSYQCSNGLSGPQFSSICGGIYECVATDVNGCIVSATTTIDSGSQVNPVLIFTNNDHPDTAIVDTFTTVILEDCSIDYSEVKSATITNIAYSGEDTVLVTWSLLDVIDMAIATNTVPYQIVNPDTGIYIATLIIYCSQKSVATKTLQISDAIYVDAMQLIKEEPDTIESK